MIFIGIDIAKNTHFASAVNSDGEILVNPFSFENSKKGFDLFLSKFKNIDLDNCLVGLESTGHYGDNLIVSFFPKGLKLGLSILFKLFFKEFQILEKLKTIRLILF